MTRRSVLRGSLPATRRLLVLTLVAALGSVVVIALSGGDAGVLGLAPAVAIALLLSRRRYPGAGLLLAMRSRPARRASRRGLAPLAPVPRIVATTPRGGLLLARSLAVRPPPLALSAR